MRLCYWPKTRGRGQSGINKRSSFKQKHLLHDRSNGKIWGDSASYIHCQHYLVSGIGIGCYLPHPLSLRHLSLSTILQNIYSVSLVELCVRTLYVLPPQTSRHSNPGCWRVWRGFQPVYSWMGTSLVQPRHSGKHLPETYAISQNALVSLANRPV